MTDDAILCNVLDEEGSETEDDTDDVSNEPTYVHNLVMCVKLWLYFENTYYLVIMKSLFTNV